MSPSFGALSGGQDVMSSKHDLFSPCLVGVAEMINDALQADAKS
jgi:hypothetical protein